MKRKILKTTHTVKSLIIFSLLILTQNLLQSQVLTTILGEDENIYDYIPWYFPDAPSASEASPIDVQEVLENDKKDKSITARYGIKQAIGLSKNDGILYEFGNYKVWKILVHSDSARSMSFQFSGLSLPQGSAMVIHGFNKRMIHGPITHDNVTEGKFASDIVYGDSAFIEVFLPNDTEEAFYISIDNLIHGITSAGARGGEKAFSDSENCNINVVCEEGDDWQDQISAVCLILAGGIEHCTGTLLNNECNDLTPYILTAEHCVSGSDLSSWVFRFNYHSLTCEEFNAPPKSSYFSFSGGTLRASWADSDFALVEINSSVAGEPSLNFAGWDRSGVAPNTSTYIHHPSGDVKKITYDDGPYTINGNNFNFELTPDQNGDFGTLEPGSSGCPQFNTDGLVVGQQSGGTPLTILCTTTESDNWNGRFDISWDGGGTNASRLSNWLGGIDDPISLDGLTVPSITGSGFLCDGNQNTYVLNDPLPNHTVTWSVSPASLFGSPTSGIGTSADLWPASHYSKGSATLTFTLENPDCGTLEFSKQFWVGTPLITGIQTPECFDPGENYVLTAIAEGGNDFLWSFPDCPNGDPIIPDPECWYNYTGNAQQIYVYTGQQGGSISVWVTNPCGTSSINVPIGDFCDDTPGSDLIFRSNNNDRPDSGIDFNNDNRIVISPNPVSGTVTLKLNDLFYQKEAKKIIGLYDVNGRLAHIETINKNKWTKDVNDLAAGVYYLKVLYKSELSFQKLIIQ